MLTNRFQSGDNCMVSIFYRISFWTAVAALPAVFLYNDRLFTALNCDKNGGRLDMFFLFLTSLADGLWVAMIAAIVQSLRPRHFGIFLIALILGNLILHGGKFLFDSDRPLRLLGSASVCVLGQPLTVRSFPSGHSFAIMLLFMFVRPARSLPLAMALLALTVLAVISRAYVGAHFPRDMIVGALIAVVSYLAAEKLAVKIKPWGWPAFTQKLTIAAAGLAVTLGYIFFYHEKTRELEFLLTPAAWCVAAYWVIYSGVIFIRRVRPQA